MKRTIKVTINTSYEVDEKDFDDSYAGVESFGEALRMDQQRAENKPFVFIQDLLDDDKEGEITIKLELVDPSS